MSDSEMPIVGGQKARAMQRAFVTGGAGFIGGHLIRRLVSEGVQVVALARSTASAEKVARAGAQAHIGSLHDRERLARAMSGCDTVFHAGSHLPDWDLETAMRENVEGSLRLAAAASEAGVGRIIYVSGTGVTVGSGPVVRWDETRPRGKPVGVLCRSRVASEEAMLGQNGRGVEVVVTRFPYVWGPGETLTPALEGAIRAGRFRWINGGRHLISVLHVENAVQGMLLAARHGRPGEIYWFTDGEPVRMRDFYEAHLRAAGLPSPDREIAYPRARRLADTLFALYRLFGAKKAPPLTPTLVRFMGQEITVVDGKARRELGYSPTVDWNARTHAPSNA